MRKARVYFQLVESAGQSTATRFVYTLFLIVIYFILCQSCRLNENLSYTPLFTTGRCNNHPSHSNLPETNDNNDDFILFYIFIYPCVYTHFFLYKYIYIFLFPFHSRRDGLALVRAISLCYCRLCESFMIFCFADYALYYYWSYVTSFWSVYWRSSRGMRVHMCYYRHETLYHVNNQGWIWDKRENYTLQRDSCVMIQFLLELVLVTLLSVDNAWRWFNSYS